MKGRRIRQSAGGVSLFPFLAVLICMMGALIVLLVLMVQQASEAADDTVAQQQQRQNEEAEALRQQQEDFQWRRDILAEQREKAAAKLADDRAALAHLEDHIRRLEDEGRRLQQQIAALAAPSSDSAQNLQQQLAELQTQLARANAELAQAQQQAQGRSQSFAIVPYQGRSGTNRRPIFVECTSRGVVLQPEGILLEANDFRDPLGPGNPLDAALLATREYLARYGNEQASKAYPLLVVRPDGAYAYAAARSAMSSWDDEFGYELIDADMQLEYPAPDPALAEVITRAVEQARARQQAIAEAIPARMRNGAVRGLRALPNGGFAVVGGSGGGLSPWEENGFDGPEGASGGGLSGSGLGSGNSSFGGRFGEGTGAALRNAGINAGGNRSPEGTGGSEYPSGSSSPFGQDNNAVAGNSQDSERPFGQGGMYPTSPPADFGSATSGGRGNEQNRYENSSGESGTASNQPGGTSSSSGSPVGGQPSGQFAGQAGQPGQSGQPGGQAGQQAGQVGQSGTSGGQAGQSGGQATLQAGGSQQAGTAQGKNWALPKNRGRATAITRPMRVALLPDRMIITPANKDRQPQTVKLYTTTDETFGEFLTAVGSEVDSWGIAVAGGYWQPVLLVDVWPGAESRFRDLQRLMRNSGIEIERRER